MLLKKLALKSKNENTKGIFGPKRKLAKLPSIGIPEDTNFNDMKQEDEEMKKYSKEKTSINSSLMSEKPKIKNLGTRIISKEELKRHSALPSAWTCIRGVVYDISDFCNEHSGGRIVLQAAGKDGTSLFTQNHSARINLENSLKRYKIGKMQ